MKQQTLGEMIASLRKERGMTQLELADRMGVTDKAVSKWERDLCCPDVHSLPKLAELLGVSVDALMRAGPAAPREGGGAAAVITLVCKAVALAMGVAVTVLSGLRAIGPDSGVALLGIGLACAGLALLRDGGGAK